MSLHVLGINHQTAPVALRETVAFGPDAIAGALQSLRGVDGVHEAVLLSTCNRTELYARSDCGPDALTCWLAGQQRVGGDLQAYLYRHEEGAAVRHLFRVATGLDSLVLGEPQILGQVKQAWSDARNAGSLGGPLDRAFQQAFATAKRARTQTTIGRNPVSVASAAVRLAQESFARLAESDVLLIGAGETIELAARHLVAGKVRRLLVANRTLAHAQELASRHGGIALPLEELDRHLAEADIVISATAARTPILHRAHFEHALRLRRHRPMLLLDLAVPRDIAHDVSGLRDVFLYTVDDLEQAIEGNRASRREAAEQAEAIIEVQASRFLSVLGHADSGAPLRRLRAHGDAAQAQALAKARAQLAAGRDPNEVLDLLAHSLTRKLLHAPSAALREDASLGEAIIRLFPGADGQDEPA